MANTATVAYERIPHAARLSPSHHGNQAAGHQALPLWLTEGEVEALILLCTASPADAGHLETSVMVKLGEMFRAFSR